MTDGLIYAAHSGKMGTEPLRDHLRLVAQRAKEYADIFGAGEEAYLAGILHDLGKYGELFQKRLTGEEKGIDHWSAGAWAALTNFRDNGIGLASALAIEGHHIGLLRNRSLRRYRTPSITMEATPQELRLSNPDFQALLERLRSDGLEMPPPTNIQTVCSWPGVNASDMLNERMLFSALVDADFIETEAWFKADEFGKRQYRKPGLPLQAKEAADWLRQYMVGLVEASTASPSVQQMRHDLLEACLVSADLPTGLFTLTAPTGSGKTLSMLAFALNHAIKHNLRRVVLVIPYLTIIEQTVQAYRSVFEKHLSSNQLDQYILEHHSLSGTRTQDEKHNAWDIDNRRQLLSENWDAPIVITTNVQFLESLFSNRPSACRKLHRLADSIILFDEVQTMPTSLVIPTLATLSRLTERYGSTVVFATATQPAFSHLDKNIKQHCTSGWQPREIVPSGLDLFGRARRTRYNWPAADITLSWPELAQKLEKQQQVLCVVNLKRHATQVFNALKRNDTGSVFHLSTNMCPAHRRVVLEKVRQLLREGYPCRLISTQCIEAGVDVDFPVVYRAMGPLDAIAQAAGRCNRNGKLPTEGQVYVFMPESEQMLKQFPDSGYEQAARLTTVLLNQFGSSGLDMDKPATFEDYYKRLYSVRGIGAANQEKDALYDAISRQDFVDVAKEYRIIDKESINVLVPYDTAVFARLEDEALNYGLSREWILKARPYSVGIFQPKLGDPIYLALEPIKMEANRTEESNEWYIYKKKEDYDDDMGLTPSLSPNVVIA